MFLVKSHQLREISSHKTKLKVCSCVFIPGEVEVLLTDVVGFAVWRTVELLVSSSITSTDLMDCMVPNATLSSGSPLSKGKYECRAQFVIQKMLELTLGRLCQLFLLFLASYSIGQGLSLSMVSKVRKWTEFKLHLFTLVNRISPPAA